MGEMYFQQVLHQILGRLPNISLMFSANFMFPEKGNKKTIINLSIWIKYKGQLSKKPMKN